MKHFDIKIKKVINNNFIGMIILIKKFFHFFNNKKQKIDYKMYYLLKQNAEKVLKLKVPNKLKHNKNQSKFILSKFFKKHESKSRL